MPEYLAPGVFVEEVSFRQKTIEGVGTSTTGFVGPTRYGPIRGEPELLTSFSQFERVYGGIDRLAFSDAGQNHNYMAHAVRSFFEEGGKRLYVARTYNPSDGVVADWQPSLSPPGFTLEARYPGEAGNFRVTFILKLGENILQFEPLEPEEVADASPQIAGINVLRGAQEHDVVMAGGGSPDQWEIYWVEEFFDDRFQRDSFRLRQNDPDQDAAGALAVADAPLNQVRLLTVTVLVGPMGEFGQEQAWENLTFHPERRESLSRVFEPNPTRRSTELYAPLVFKSLLQNGAAIAEALAAQNNLTSLASPGPDVTIREALEDPSATPSDLTFKVELEGGDDGDRPLARDYRGDDGGQDGRKSGLKAFEDLEDISIVAAPGSTFGYNNGYQTNAEAIIRLLISHCERMRYRIAVLDTGEGQLPGEALRLRQSLDSTRAALYYPWIRVLDPITETEIDLPPSGFVTGIYVRNDVERGVHKAPANEVLRGAIGLEFLLNTAQQELLNPEGVNCVRFFEGRGFRVWGARTSTSDPEWKYVNVRRFLAYLERSIEKGTQWAVFENNGPVLWGNVQRTVSDFLFNEWKSNRLLGNKPEEAYFVRCDRTTMTQNDLDNGRLICLVAVAPLRPAEFVIFRIGQKTADAGS